MTGICCYGSLCGSEVIEKGSLMLSDGRVRQVAQLSKRELIRLNKGYLDIWKRDV